MNNAILHPCVLDVQPSGAAAPPTANIEEALAYAEALTGSRSSSLTLVSIAPNARTETKRGTVTDLWGWITACQRKGCGIFATVNQTDGTKRTKSDITRIRALWIDADAPVAHHRDDFPVQPHFIVESSPGKFHYYWRVDDDRSDLAEEAMARMIAAHPGGDTNAKDVSRVLRLPGTLHLKGEPFMSRIVFTRDGPPCTLNAMRAAWPAAITEDHNLPLRKSLDVSAALRTIETCEPGVHDALLRLTAHLAHKGVAPELSEALLTGYTQHHSDGSPRMEERIRDIPGLVSTASAKFEPLDFPDLVEQARASNEPRYKLLGGNELRNLPPLAWRVHGVLPAVGLAALYGPSASGKSFLAFDMAAAIAEGQHWFDCRVEPAPVVYAALEGEAGLKLRALAWEASRGRTLPDGLHMMLQPFKLTETQDVIDLAAVVPPGAVVFVDTLNRAAPTADENSSRDMGEILEAAKRLQAVAGCLVVLIHHTGKDSTRGLRGHSSLFAAMDAAIEVSRDGDRREWKVAKSKDGQDGERHPFKLAVEVLGTEATGEEITSCVVVRDTATQDVRAAKVAQGPNQKAVLEVLRHLFRDGQTGRPGAPPFQQCVELEAAVSAGAAKLTCTTDRRATRAREAITALIGRGVLGCNDGWLWLA